MQAKRHIGCLVSQLQSSSRLVQAQELTYAKAAADGKSPPLLARSVSCSQMHCIVPTMLMINTATSITPTTGMI